MRTGIACLLLVLAALPAAAQVREQEKAPVVFLRQHSVPGEIQATLLRMDDQAVTLGLGGRELTLPWVEVERLEKRGDNLADGAAIGAVAAGLWCAIVCGQGLSSARELPLAIMANAGLGALIGIGFDAAHVGRTTIYRRGALPAAGRARARPAIAFTIRF